MRGGGEGGADERCDAHAEGRRLCNCSPSRLGDGKGGVSKEGDSITCSPPHDREGVDGELYYLQPSPAALPSALLLQQVGLSGRMGCGLVRTGSGGGIGDPRAGVTPSLDHLDDGLLHGALGGGASGGERDKF